MSVEIPHFALPFRIVAGAGVVVEQNSPEEISDCVAAIARYPKGLLPEEPDFGISDQTFQPGGADQELLASEVGRWEPRADLQTILDNTQIGALISGVTVSTAPAKGA